jgi:predicted metal-dependent hydrolase
MYKGAGYPALFCFVRHITRDNIKAFVYDNIIMKKDAKTLSGLEFHIQRKKMKNMRIRVTGDKRVSVSAPLRLPENRIIAFVAQHEGFIRQRLDTVEQQRCRCYPKSYASGDSFCMMGEGFSLRVMREEKAYAGFNGSELVLCVPPGGSAKTLFARFLTRTAKKVFSERLKELIPKIKPQTEGEIKLSVRGMLTRWGSINPRRKTMSLSVHLLRCEPDLIDYVILHELCHLQTASHSRAFYNALESYCPDRRAFDKRLEAYGLVDF